MDGLEVPRRPFPFHRPDMSSYGYNKAPRSASSNPELSRTVSFVARTVSSSSGKGKARAGDELVQLDPRFLQGYSPHLLDAAQRPDLLKLFKRLIALEWPSGSDSRPRGGGQRGGSSRRAILIRPRQTNHFPSSETRCGLPCIRLTRSEESQVDPRSLRAHLRLRRYLDAPFSERLSGDHDIFHLQVSLAEESDRVELAKGVSLCIDEYALARETAEGSRLTRRWTSQIRVQL